VVPASRVGAHSAIDRDGEASPAPSKPSGLSREGRRGQRRSEGEPPRPRSLRFSGVGVGGVCPVLWSRRVLQGGSHDLRVYSAIYQRPGGCSEREQPLNRSGLRSFERRPSFCRPGGAVESRAVPRGRGEFRGSWRSPVRGDPGCGPRISRVCALSGSAAGETPALPGNAGLLAGAGLSGWDAGRGAGAVSFGGAGAPPSVGIAVECRG
jgi:hypothetical protein